MSNAIWKYVLANSTDLSNIGELAQARDRTLSMTNNGSGSASFTIPMSNELAATIQPYVSAIKTYRISPVSGLLLPWSGYVSTIDENPAQDIMTVNCVGWQERLNDRYLRRQKIYTATDDGAIIQDVLSDLNSIPIPEVSGAGYTPSIPAGSSPNTSTWLAWGGTQANEYDSTRGGAWSTTTAYVQALRNKTYSAWQNAGQAVTELTQIENGCDVFVDPATRMLYVYRKKMRVRSDVLFGFQFGPNNVADFSRQIDGSTTVNYHLTTGKAGVGGQYVADTSSQATFNLLEENTNLSDVVDPNILGAYSGAEIAVRKTPRQLYSVTPFGWTSDNGVPEPLVDYAVGDQVHLVAKHSPRVNVDQMVRIFGMDIQIDNEGNERLGALKLAP